jgi:[ribosomal protein S18]-alanine N-acetyltransferase
VAEAPRAEHAAPRIEAATESDAPPLARLAADAAVPGWSESSLASTLRDASTIARVVRGAAGAPIGFALVRAAAEEVEVLLVAVDRRVRRRGIGRALLAAALARAPAARVAHLEVRASNTAAIALYEALGFVAVGRRPRYYDGGEDALTMRCELARSDG